MLTRENIVHSKLKVLLAYVEPYSVKQALFNPDWFKALQAEYQALLENKTWSLTTLSPHRKLVGCMWVFKVKENPDGLVHKYKVQLVAKGYHQQFGFDFNETLPLVIKPTIIQIILTLTLTYHWEINQIN